MSEHFFSYTKAGERFQAEVFFEADANRCKIRLFAGDHRLPILTTAVATPREVHDFFARKGVRMPDSLMESLEDEHTSHQILGTPILMRQQVFHRS